MNGEPPEGWALVRISDVTERVPNARPEDWPDRTFNYVDISSIDNSTFTITELKQFKGKDAPSRARRPVQPNDVLFSNVRTYLRNVALVQEDLKADLCSTGFTVLRPNPAIMPRYLLRYVISRDFIDRVTPQQTGTHYPATSDRVVLGERIALPPMAEQQRIVARLEEFVSKVDASRQQLEKTRAVLTRLRQAVLAAACSGRLTPDWRDTNPPNQSIDVVLETIEKGRRDAVRTTAQRQRVEQVFSRAEETDFPQLPKGWRYVSLAKLCTSFDYGTAAKSAVAGRVPVLRMGNIQNSEIDWTDLVYTSDREEIAAYSLQPKTVLFNRTNSPELVGKTGIYRGERPAVFAGYLIRVNPVAELDPEYLNYCLNTSYARAFCARVKTDGVSQSNINAQRLGTFEVPFCLLEEQREIVRRVKELFVRTNQINRRLTAARACVDDLTPSFFAKAFGGELVPTEAELARREDRTYEPASVLVARIQETRKDQESVKAHSGGKHVPKSSKGRQSARSRRQLDEVLREHGEPLTPEQLFDLAGFDDKSVDGFYEQLRRLVQDGRVLENRPNRKDVYLEAARK
jgi:type I restriction enzyme S subunit